MFNVSMVYGCMSMLYEVSLYVTEWVALCVCVCVCVFFFFFYKQN